MLKRQRFVFYTCEHPYKKMNFVGRTLDDREYLNLSYGTLFHNNFVSNRFFRSFAFDYNTKRVWRVSNFLNRIRLSRFNKNQWKNFVGNFGHMKDERNQWNFMKNNTFLRAGFQSNDAVSSIDSKYRFD